MKWYSQSFHQRSTLVLEWGPHNRETLTRVEFEPINLDLITVAPPTELPGQNGSRPLVCKRVSRICPCELRSQIPNAWKHCHLYATEGQQTVILLLHLRVYTISKQMQESTRVWWRDLDSVKYKADSAIKIFQKLIKSPQESSGLKPIECFHSRDQWACF